MNACEIKLLQALSNLSAKTLWIVDENIDQSFVGKVVPSPLLQAVTNRCDLATQLQNKYIQTVCSDFEFAEVTQIQQIIYRVSKERVLVEHCIQHAAALLIQGGKLILIGEKQEGIKTYAKFAQQHFATQVSTQKDGLAYQVEANLGPAPSVQNNLPTEYATLHDFNIDGLQFTSKPGLYGWKKIDAGSRILIDTIKPLLNEARTEDQTCLDLGCGYGFLTLALQDVNLAKRLATDNNITATNTAKINFAQHQLSVDLSLDNCAEKISQPVDIIVCNPPFHQGFQHKGDLIELFLQTTLRLLKPNAKAYFVVNEFIPLPKVVANLGGQQELLIKKDGFRVYSIYH